MPRTPHTRQRLLGAALEVAAEHGYAATTTRAVAERAGVSEGAIYRHFPTKLALLAAAVADQNAATLAVMRELPSRAGQRTVEVNLTEVMQLLASAKESVLPLELAMLTDPELAQARSQLLAAGLPPGPPRDLVDYLEAERALGRLRPELDCDETAVVLLASLFGVATTAAIDAAAVVRTIVRGIAPPEAVTATS